jgi:hypothetical protein
MPITPVRGSKLHAGSQNASRPQDHFNPTFRKKIIKLDFPRAGARPIPFILRHHSRVLDGTMGDVYSREASSGSSSRSCSLVLEDTPAQHGRDRNAAAYGSDGECQYHSARRTA